MTRGWGWAGSVEAFLAEEDRAILESLETHHRALLGAPPAETQRAAWRSECITLRSALADVRRENPSASDWGLVFEYELPLEGGRRPDVVALAGTTVVVLEFKLGPVAPGVAAIDQVQAYGRDLAEYHEETHRHQHSQPRSVLPVLVLPEARGLLADLGKAVAVSGELLGGWLSQVGTEGEIDLQAWLESSYAPLPTLVNAARRIFEHEHLPHVRRALSARIPETVELVTHLAEEAERSHRRLLVFVTGVPGSGKTLVGLRCVYEHSNDDRVGTFLSGNGPLVKVLQDALKSRVFVKDLHAYIRTYGMNQRQPKEHLVVFDEAQRAWDSSYMLTKKGIERSEPELLMEAATRLEDWNAFVGLVGDGQEIHSGEEGGIAQWRAALAALPDSDSWEIHCPPRLGEQFDGLRVVTHDLLDLTVSLRSRLAERLHEWVVHLLRGSIDLASRVAVHAQDCGFVQYLSRDLDEITEYCRNRYASDPDARYGLVASSHTKSLPRFDVDNSFLATSRMNIAAWYNAPPDDPKSCCQLLQPVTEFGCQGLEVDLPVVCWGEDMLWDEGHWSKTAVRRRYPLENPDMILENVYRVLLTRGRDGFIVFVPPDSRFDATAATLERAGVRPLEVERARLDRAVGL